jgi:CRISPR-associated exonuclease Cas4
MQFNQNLITGTLMHYYATCKREAWLYSRKIHADQHDENILMGKAIAEIKEEQLNDFPFSNLKFDKIGKQRGHYMVTEYKKSMSNKEGAKMQLLFYMWQLKATKTKKAYKIEYNPIHESNHKRRTRDIHRDSKSAKR